MIISYVPPTGTNKITGPIGDGEGNEIYGTNTTRENLVGILGKRKKRSNEDRASVR
jgi:hypothetical protein